MVYTAEQGFPYYYDLVRNEDLNSLFSSKATLSFFQSISEGKAAHRYRPNKWSIKQIVGHVTDHERIKMFRAFQLSRNETVELWGYDQDSLVNNARFDELPMKRLIEDYSCTRKASQSFICTLSEKQLKIIGKARDYELSLEEFLKSIIGHERHHVNFMKENYLK